jgi:hypothetical protein
MAPKANVFNDAFFEFLDKLRDLELFSQLVEMQVVNAIPRLETAFNEAKKKAKTDRSTGGAPIGITSNLPILDFFGAPETRLAYGKKSAAKKQMLGPPGQALLPVPRSAELCSTSRVCGEPLDVCRIDDYESGTKFGSAAKVGDIGVDQIGHYSYTACLLRAASGREMPHFVAIPSSLRSHLSW